MNVHSYLNGSLHVPEYPENCAGYKYLDFSEVGLEDGMRFQNIDELRKFVNKLEDMLKDYPEVQNIEISDDNWSIDFNYIRPPDKYEIKQYEDELYMFNLIKEYEDCIKERYSELEEQSKEAHNKEILAEIEKLKKKLK